MNRGEFKVPEKVWSVSTSEEGQRIVDMHLVDPETGILIGGIYGLAPADLLRVVRTQQAKRVVPIREYVEALASDDGPLESNEVTVYN